VPTLAIPGWRSGDSGGILRTESSMKLARIGGVGGASTIGTHPGSKGPHVSLPAAWQGGPIQTEKLSRVILIRTSRGPLFPIQAWVGGYRSRAWMKEASGGA